VVNANLKSSGRQVKVSHLSTIAWIRAVSARRASMGQ